MGASGLRRILPWCRPSSFHSWTFAIAFWVVSSPQVSPNSNPSSIQLPKQLLKNLVPDQSQSVAEVEEEQSKYHWNFIPIKRKNGELGEAGYAESKSGHST
ncbi:uncharacterized protein ACOB8E_024256 isoform 1-T3 [Sarcophilus harrisii]